MAHHKKIFLALLLIPQLVAAHRIFIIVPGTWSTQSTWHSPGGIFFETLAKTAAPLGAQVTTFVWSGKNSHAARVQAARELANFIENYDEVDLVTHSHGSNVGILASHLLGKKNQTKKIKNFFALATPILPQEYFPDMQVVQHFFNFFSLADKVQTVLGFFQRTFPPHERIANLRVTINGQAPSHSGIHDPAVAQFLPVLATGLPAEKITHFFAQPGLLHFFHHTAPHYQVDKEQRELIALEQAAFKLDFVDRGRKK